jgi:F-box-like
VTIDVLPDDVLVEIFGFYENIDTPRWSSSRNIMWHTLVHVCRRWRYVVFASPRRLNLRLTYHGHRPMSEVLDAWPVLPVSLMSESIVGRYLGSDQRWDNIVAGLESEHSNRICEIYIGDIINSRERFAGAMQKSFPELTHLAVWAHEVAPVLPDSFLGGSAPRLRSLELERIPFPSIPKLLLSATGLVRLALWDIPHSGYFSPDEMATALTVMTSLESLHLRFGSPQSRPNPASRPLPPPTRFVLPALTQLIFKGVYEYLEVLLARVDAPLLDKLYIEFFMDLDFDVPQLHRFIVNVEKFKAFNRADVVIYGHYIQLVLYPNRVEVDDHRPLELRINCGQLDSQLSSLAQVFTSFFPLISALEELKIRGDRNLGFYHWKHDMEDARWLELLDSFTALKNLYLAYEIVRPFCRGLQELSGERTTEVLPALRNLFVQGSSLEPLQEALMAFVIVRRLSGHPVVVGRWDD